MFNIFEPQFSDSEDMEKIHENIPFKREDMRAFGQH